MLQMRELTCSCPDCRAANGENWEAAVAADLLGCELTVLMPAVQSCQLRPRGAGRQAAADGGHDSNCKTDYQSGQRYGWGGGAASCLCHTGARRVSSWCRCSLTVAGSQQYTAWAMARVRGWPA